jgi:hypothetical protein
MSREDEIEQEVRILIMELMMVLYNHNITEIHVGALMRLIGVEDDKATESDDERIQIDERFSKYIKQMVDLTLDIDHDQTLH